MCSLKSSLHISLNIELTFTHFPSLDLFIQPTSYHIHHPSTMVFTAGQLTSFFDDADQCRLVNRARVSLLNVEGITFMDDLADWEDDDWDRQATSCKKSDKVLFAGALVEQRALEFTVTSPKRFKIASSCVCY